MTKKSATRQSGPCPRKSVGIVVLNSRNEMLCLYRKSFPPGLACPAGHLEYVGSGKVLEPPSEAAIRELREETGLQVTGLGRPLLHATFPNPCKSGFDSHEWWVYGVRYKGEVPQEMSPVEPEKHAFLKFLSPKEIVEYVTRDDCDPAWQKYIWPALFASHAPYFHVVSDVRNAIRNIEPL